MEWLAPIDQYCERTGPGFLAEPLNFISNIGFLIAGMLVVRSLQKAHFRHQRSGAWVLAILLLTIGVGSALFHSFANVWSMWADVIPIAIFVITYLWLFLRHTVGATVINSLLGLIFFCVLSIAVVKLANPSVANGGEAYFGTWISLFGISCFYAGRKQAHNQGRVFAAALLFAISIVFRTIDPIVCEALPTGTHVYWHLCNSVVLYLVTMAYISERSKV
jgi:hypothetical protein